MKPKASGGIKVDRKGFYTDVEKRWMKFHIGAITVATCFQLTAELVMMFLLEQNGVSGRSVASYVSTYVALPSGINILTILANLLVVYKTKLPHRAKCLILSMSFFFCIFIVTSVHNIFSSIYLLFTLPLILTTAYHSQIITGSGALVGLVLMFMSKLFFADANPDNSAQSMYMLNFMMDIIVFIVVYIICIFIIIHQRREQNHALLVHTEVGMLKDKNTSDSLTGLKNQASFKTRISKITSEEGHYILAVMDICNLHLINDKFGHMVGDELIEQFARLLQTTCGSEDVYRYGGDMFCVVFNSNEPQTIIYTLNRLRAVFLNFARKNYTDFELDLNVGLASSYGLLSGREVFENADKALVQAKNSTADNVVFFKK